MPFLNTALERRIVCVVQVLLRYLYEHSRSVRDLLHKSRKQTHEKSATPTSEANNEVRKVRLQTTVASLKSIEP